MNQTYIRVLMSSNVGMVEIDPKAYKKWIVADYRRRMKARAVEYKGGMCEVCGYTKCQAALEFHHRDPLEKDFRISQGNSWSWAKIQPELDKCALLCATCHREEHFRIKLLALEEQEAIISAQRATRRETRRVAITSEIVPEALKLNLCQECGNPTDQKKFCSQTCFRLDREKAAWPSDEELHKLLWERPATKVAGSLGVSSVAVKKRCKLRGIPTPPRGYWAKLLKVSPSR